MEGSMGRINIQSKIFKIVTFFIACIVALASCTKKNQENSSRYPKEETLHINISSEPPTLDWHKSTDTTSASIQDNIMEGLVEYDYDKQALPLKPALAKSWRSYNGAKKWILALQEGVKWSDGLPLTAQHVIDGWERLLNPKTASEYAYFLYGIENARAYNTGKLKDFSKVGVSINTKGEIVVQLNGPKSYFPYLLTHHSTYPIRKDIVQKYGDAWTNPGNIVTLGPYSLKRWVHDKEIVLEKSPSYYGKPAHIPYIFAHIISEMSTAINLFETGRLDVQRGVIATEIKRLRKNPEYHESKILSIYYYGFNVKKPPLDNVKVRQALSLALNQKEITDFLDGGQVPLYSWIPSSMFGHAKNVGLLFDIKKANKLLDQAGYKDRKKFPKISIAFNTNENHQRIAENVQAQWKKHLGISVELKNEEWKVYLSTLKSDTPHIFRLGWLSDYPDPDDYMSLMLSYSDNNHTHWKNPQYDTLVQKGSQIVDKKKRMVFYTKAQRILIERDTPVIPIYSGVAQSLISHRIAYFPFNVMGRLPLKKVKFKKTN